MLFPYTHWIVKRGQKSQVFNVSLVASSIGSLEEREHVSMICRVLNIIFSEFFFLFSIDSPCWIWNAKSKQDVRTLKGVIDRRALLG